MKSIVIFCFQSLLFIGCRYYSEIKYHIGQDFNFKNKNDFIIYLKKKNAFPLDKYLYVDSTCYSKFVFNQLKQNQSSLYLGTFLNDSISIKPSCLLKKNSSCAGRIENEIARTLSMKHFPDSMLESSLHLSDYRFRFLENGKLLDINQFNEKINILLLYSYGMGNYYDKFFQKIRNLKNVFVVCVDPVYKLK